MALALVYNQKVMPAAWYAPKSAGGWFFQNLFTSEAAPAPKAPVFNPNAGLMNMMRF